MKISIKNGIKISIEISILLLPYRGGNAADRRFPNCLLRATRAAAVSGRQCCGSPGF